VWNFQLLLALWVIVGWKIRSNLQNELNDLNRFILKNKIKIANEIGETSEINQPSANIYNLCDPSFLSKIKLVENSSINPQSKNKNNEAIIDNNTGSDKSKEETNNFIKQYNDIKEEVKNLKLNLTKVNEELFSKKRSKIIKFDFGLNTITWILEEKHVVDFKIKLILNPISSNKDIYQVFFI